MSNKQLKIFVMSVQIVTNLEIVLFQFFLKYFF